MPNIETKNEHIPHASRDHACCGGQHAKGSKSDPRSNAPAGPSVEKKDEQAHRHGSSAGCCGTKNGAK